jgi:glutaminase
MRFKAVPRQCSGPIVLESPLSAVSRDWSSSTSLRRGADLERRQRSLNVSAMDLSVMAPTLAAGDVNPITRQRVVSAEYATINWQCWPRRDFTKHRAIGSTRSAYPERAASGGIATASPGKGGLGTIAPPLGQAGSSVKGRLVARFMSQRLAMDLFASRLQTE